MIVVAGQRRQSERDRVQAGGFRREIGPRGVGAAHDQREPRQRRLAFQPEQLEHGVEAAARALVRNLHAFDVERDGAGLLGDFDDLIGIDIENARLRIDEAADQPRAGDAVDLRPPPRDPEARPLRREAVERGLARPAAAWLRSRRHSRRPARARRSLRRADAPPESGSSDARSGRRTRPAGRDRVRPTIARCRRCRARSRRAARPARRRRPSRRRVSTICGARPVPISVQRSFGEMKIARRIA